MYNMLIFNINFIIPKQRLQSGFKPGLYKALAWLDDLETYREDSRYCNKWC
jgi:hypothetical protein